MCYLLICCSISKDKLTALLQWYKLNGLLPRKKSGGRNVKSLQIEDIRCVVSFITNYAESNAVHLPGRLAAHYKSNIQLFPTSITKVAIFRLYENSLKQTGKTEFILDSFVVVIFQHTLVLLMYL